MSGFQLARELKHINPTVPLVMFTSFKTPQLEKEALAYGCNAIFQVRTSADALR